MNYFCCLQMFNGLLSQIEADSDTYFVDYWTTRRRSGKILSQQGYFDRLKTTITGPGMSKNDLDQFAATHIGDLYKLLVSTRISNSTMLNKRS